MGRAITCLSVLLLCALTTSVHASVSMISCDEEVATKRQQKLAEELRVITGWSNLHFDAGRGLQLGDAAYKGGSQTARELLASALNGRKQIVIEDASGSYDVVFGRVVEAQRIESAVFVVQIDFSDFSQVIGDADALAAFNAGWVALHELHHITSGLPDTSKASEVGECETLINVMRRESGLAVRAEYHFYFLPTPERNEFKSRFVRLAFERQDASTNKKRRVFLMWDASFVGGLPPPSTPVSFR